MISGVSMYTMILFQNMSCPKMTSAQPAEVWYMPQSSAIHIIHLLYSIMQQKSSWPFASDFFACCTVNDAGEAKALPWQCGRIWNQYPPLFGFPSVVSRMPLKRLTLLTAWIPSANGLSHHDRSKASKPAFLDNPFLLMHMIHLPSDGFETEKTPIYT